MTVFIREKVSLDSDPIMGVSTKSPDNFYL